MDRGIAFANYRMQALVASLFSALLLTGNVQAQELMASAKIVTCGETPAEIGAAFLRERPSEEGVKLVDIVVRINAAGLPPGKHAVHLHETGQCQPCSAARGHVDPGPHANSNPDGNHPFHAGDLINLSVGEDGSGTLFTTTSRITLAAGPLSIIDADGSAFIIHVDPDTYCPEGNVAGCAGGARAACGVIERLR